MAELVDATDLKSVASNGVRVQVPLWVPILIFVMNLISEQDPFSPKQAKLLNQILPQITPEQATWLKGYLTAVGGVTAQASIPAEKSEPVTILFGSETGNAEGLAQNLSQMLKGRNVPNKVYGMDAYKHKNLSKESRLLLLTSTWGEGEPPENAVDFYQFVMSEKAPDLKNLEYAVFSLGDSSYEHFCKTGKDFDSRFEQLGAQRLIDRVDCDGEFDTPFEEWGKSTLELLSSTAVVSGSFDSGTFISPPAITYDRKNPFSAILLENINLNATGSAKETRHLEISLEDSGITYEPGDALGVYPSNCPEYTDDLIRIGKFNPNVLVSTPDNGECAFRDALLHYYDITTANQATLKKWVEISGSATAKAFLEKDQATQGDYFWGRELIDILQDFYDKTVSEQDFVSLLRKIPARLYSIASSLKAHPEEVHLTVGAVRYQGHGRVRKGVCSTYMADRVPIDQTLPIYTHANKKFKLPTSPDAPVIMVGPGTGIAPFRSFIEERNEMGASGKNWLFFGDQHFNTDFLYQTEWQAYQKSGLLSKIDLAFSRDTSKKVYVQHRIMEKSKEIYEWIQEGAYFYVCGDASRMAKDVHQTLIDVIQKESAMTAEAASNFVKNLQTEKRYQRDVY